MLTPKSYPFIFPLFQFCSDCPVSVLVSEQTPICLKHHRQSIQNQKKKKNAFTIYFPPPEIQPPHHLQNPFTTSLPNHISCQATRRLLVNQSPLTQQLTNPICQSWPSLKHHTSCQKSQPPQPTNHQKNKRTHASH